MANEVIPPGHPKTESGPSPAVKAASRPAANRNLVTAELPEVFIAGRHDESLKALYRSAVAKAHEAVEWYARAVKRKREHAQLVRMFTVVLGAFAAIIPIVTPMLEKLSGSSSILPLATVAAALAGSLVAADRY